MAGLTTFFVMAYIIFLNPAILHVEGAPSMAALATATCVVAAVFSILMGRLANWPLALAPGLGINAIVAFQLMGGLHLSFAEAMTLILLEGLLAVALVLLGLREAVVKAIPYELKLAIGVGIGLFLGFIGLVDSGIVVKAAGEGGPPVALGSFTTWSAAVALFSLVLMIYLTARKVTGALLISIVVGTIAAMVVNSATDHKAFGDVVATWPSLSEAFSWGDWSSFGQFDLGAFDQLGVIAALVWVFVLFQSDFFDTMGTATAVGKEADILTNDGQLPDVKPLLLVDSFAAAGGGVAGTSSVTCYIESGAGVAEGGRTGWTAIVTGLCFIPFIFVSELANLVPLAVMGPALVIVAYYMVSTLTGDLVHAGDREGQRVAGINFLDLSKGLPALLIMIMMPFSFSIANGIGFGFIAYVLIMLAQGRLYRVHPLMKVSAAAFLLYFLVPLLQQQLSWI